MGNILLILKLLQKNSCTLFFYLCRILGLRVFIEKLIKMDDSVLLRSLIPINAGDLVEVGEPHSVMGISGFLMGRMELDELTVFRRRLDIPL